MTFSCSNPNTLLLSPNEPIIPNVESVNVNIAAQNVDISLLTSFNNFSVTFVKLVSILITIPATMPIDYIGNLSDKSFPPNIIPGRVIHTTPTMINGMNIKNHKLIFSLSY